MAEIEDDFDFMLSNFKKSTNTITKTKGDFKSFMESKMVSLNKDTESLLNNPEGLILLELKTIEYRTGGNNQTARVKFLLNHLSKDILKEYKHHIISIYPKTLFEEDSKVLSKKDDDIKNKISEWRKLNNNNPHYPKEIELEKRDLVKEELNFHEFRARIDSIFATFDELIPENVYGDETLEIEGLESVYFNFPDNENVDDRYLEVFVKELRRIQSPHIQLIRKITIESVSVKLWFDSIEDAEKFYSTKTFVEGIYDKYVRRVSKHKVELVWGVSYKNISN